MGLMDYKKLFLQCFPNKQVWYDFLSYRFEVNKNRERAARINKQMEARRKEMMEMTTEPDDDNYDITEDIWDKVKES